MRARKRRNTRSRAARPSTSPSTRARRSPSFATDIPPGAIDFRKRSPDAHDVPASLARATPREAQRCGRSHPSQSLDAAATGNFSSHPDGEPLDQYAMGAADRRRGAALPDCAGAKPSRASERDGLHSEPSRHCAVRPVCGLRLPVVAAAPTFPEHVLHAVYHAGRPANPGRSPEALLGSRLHAGNRLVPVPGSGPEGPYLDRQG